MRNKTLTLSPDSPEGAQYLARCRRITAPVENPEEVWNTTILGDCFDVLPCMPKESVDLIIADPPYNRRKSFGSLSFKPMEQAEYAAWTRRWLELVMPLLKPDGTIYVFTDWQSGMIVGPVLAEFAMIRNRITWQREKGRGARANWKNGMEDIWFATKSDSYTFRLDAVRVRRRVLAPYRADGVPKDWQETPDGRYRDTCPSNFWDDITVPFWSMPENTAHPTQKPEKLMARLILASSGEGDVVMDPFVGSGTSSVAAKKLNRRYIGIDREREYCCWCEKRLEDAHPGDPIQGYSGGVFWERNSLGEQRRRKPKPEAEREDSRE